MEGGKLLSVIGDADTCSGFLLAGVGHVDMRRNTNYMIVNQHTQVRAIEAKFKELTARDDIAIVLISQNVANMIRHAIDQHTRAVPSVLEIPSKDQPYDPGQDSLLMRVKHIMGCE